MVAELSGLVRASRLVLGGLAGTAAILFVAAGWLGDAARPTTPGSTR